MISQRVVLSKTIFGPSLSRGHCMTVSALNWHFMGLPSWADCLHGSATFRKLVLVGQSPKDKIGRLSATP